MLESKPLRLICYARVSTDEDKQEFSLEAQLDKCRMKCRLHEHEVVEEIVDTASGKDLKRDGIQRALRLIAEGHADGIVVYSLSRLSRHLGDVFNLVNGQFKSASFISVQEEFSTTTASGRLVLYVMAILSQFEREQIGERTKMVLDHKRTSGDVYCGSLFGYTKQHTGKYTARGKPKYRLVEHPVHHKTLQTMMQMHRDGRSYSYIARFLNEGGFATEKQGTWAPITVSRIIKRELRRLADKLEAARVQL